MSVIEVSRFIPVARGKVHALLSDVEAHRSLSDPAIQLLAADQRQSAGQGVIRLDPPIPVERTVVTKMTERREPGRVAGTADIGRRRLADIVWDLEICGDGTIVRLSATARDVSPAEQLLLWLGGAWWLRRRFRSVLDRLEGTLTRAES